MNLLAKDQRQFACPRGEAVVTAHILHRAPAHASGKRQQSRRALPNPNSANQTSALGR